MRNSEKRDVNREIVHRLKQKEPVVIFNREGSLSSNSRVNIFGHNLWQRDTVPKNYEADNDLKNEKNQ